MLTSTSKLKALSTCGASPQTMPRFVPSVAACPSADRKEKCFTQRYCWHICRGKFSRRSRLHNTSNCEMYTPPFFTYFGSHLKYHHVGPTSIEVGKHLSCYGVRMFHAGGLCYHSSFSCWLHLKSFRWFEVTDSRVGATGGIRYGNALSSLEFFRFSGQSLH